MERLPQQSEDSADKSLRKSRLPPPALHATREQHLTTKDERYERESQPRASIRSLTRPPHSQPHADASRETSGNHDSIPPECNSRLDQPVPHERSATHQAAPVPASPGANHLP